MKIWSCDSFSVCSDGDKFIAQIQAGITGETYLSVGYSSPNGALHTSSFNFWCLGRDDFCRAKIAYEDYYRVPYDIKEILSDVLQTYYETEIDFLELDQMLTELYKLARLANEVYNKFLCSESKWSELREFYTKRALKRNTRTMNNLNQPYLLKKN